LPALGSLEHKIAAQSRFVRRTLWLSASLTVSAAVAAAPASAARVPVKFERVAGFKSPGTPAKYNKVGILKAGSPKAKNVLVLNPGTSASASYFLPLAKSIVERSPRWQVWSVERRENLLEDQSVANRAKAGKATPKQLFDYYLGWLDDDKIKPHFQFIPDSAVGFARDWGMNTEVQDLRRVVKRADKLGGKVVVGGHSLGGSITTAYATWDFNGVAGARGVDGLVFIDGGSGPTSITKDEADKALSDLDAGSPWLSFGGIPAPFAGLFNSGGSILVKIAPNAPALAQNFSLLPDSLKPPVPATNAGQFGYALDTETSPAPLAAAQAHLGHLAASGDPRGWSAAAS
jgi:pimeloyl-ACP methyl ester carboxylesterase